MNHELVTREGGEVLLLEVRPPIDWPDGEDFVVLLRGSGYERWTKLGNEFHFSFTVYHNSALPAEVPGGFPWLVLMDTGDYIEEIWSRNLNAVMAFLREQAPTLSAVALERLVELYAEQREDADAKAAGYKNRNDQTRAFMDRIRSERCAKTRTGEQGSQR